MVYDQTLQAEALSLVAAKTRASLMVEGELPEEGLAALDGDGGDVFLALARRLAEPSGEMADERSLEALFALAQASDQENDQVLGADWTGADAEAIPEIGNLPSGDVEGTFVVPRAEEALAVPVERVLRFEQLSELLRSQRHRRVSRSVPQQPGLFAA